jgi:hypothetical protein
VYNPKKRTVRVFTEKPMTFNELILDCLQLGLEGEKVDYEWDRKDEHSAVLKFEDGHKVRITLEEIN